MAKSKYNPYLDFVPKNENSEEIDIKDFIVHVWTKRRFVLVISTIFLILGFIVAFIAPVKYTSSCTVVPQTGGSGQGALGGMASMMGLSLNMGSQSRDVLSPSVYPEIVMSVPFCKEILETSIVVHKSNGVPITLSEYYDNPYYQDNNVLDIIKEYSIGLPRTILKVLRSQNSTRTSNEMNDTLNIDINTLSGSERQAISNIRENISFQSNSRSGYISIAFSFPEPQASAVITKSIVNTLERYVQDYKTQKQSDNLEFVYTSFKDAKNDFLQKQSTLAAFQDANRSLTTASARAMEQRLRSEFDIAFTVYNELAKQLEQAKLTVKESTPLFTVIEPVIVPYQKSAPRRTVIIGAFLLVGMFISVVWVLVKPFFADIVERTKNLEITDKNQISDK